MTYSTSEVVALCRIPLSTLRRYLAEGKLPEAQKIGRDLRYPASWVAKWEIPEGYIKLSEYAKKRKVSRQAVHTWIKEGRVTSKQSFTGLWWVLDVGS